MNLLKGSTFEPVAVKKLLFKVYRDQARLFALKREEGKAHEAHRRAEKILKEDLVVQDSNAVRKSLNHSMRQESSIKIAKLQLLKGLWSSKFSWDKSIEEMVEAFHLFADAIGEEENYYGANCQMEIGQNYMRKKDTASAREFLNTAVNTYEKLFGENHPIIQKYYNYSSELFSFVDDKQSMLLMANKYVELVEKTNRPSDSAAPPSIFTLDALLQMISMQCQANDNGDLESLINTNLKKMEDICAENGIADGCQLLHSAYTMKIMGMITPTKFKEALELVQDVYPK